MKIQVDVNTTKKDYMQFQRHHMLRYMWIYALFLVAAGVLSAMIIINKKNTGEINEVLSACLFIVAAAFLYLLVSSVISIIKTARAENKKPMFSYTFTKGGVNCKCNGKSFDIAWTKIYKVTEMRSMFLIYTDKQNAFIVPKRCFADKDSLDEFRQELVFSPKTPKK